MAKKAMKVLNIGQPVQVLRAARPPMINGHPMTIGELLCQIIPMLPDRGDYMRIWSIGLDIDRAIGAGKKTLELSDLDYTMLKKNVIRPDDGRETWAKANLERAFEEVK